MIDQNICLCNYFIEPFQAVLDLVSIGEWPNDETASTTALAIASRGTVRTTTMRAFTPEEFAEIVKKLP